MNKIELVGIIREIVKDEFKEMLKSKEGRAILKEVIAKEVHREVDRLLTEMEEASPVLAETAQMPRLASMVEHGELPPTKKPQPNAESVQFTKNNKINEALNQTLASIVSGQATLPSQEGSEGAFAALREQYGANGFNPMPSQTAATHQSDSTGKSVNQMLPDRDVNGNPMRINAAALPTDVKNALTRDYRKLLKRIDEPRG